MQVETSAFHVHCPGDLAAQLTAGYNESSQDITWMNIIVDGDRLKFQDNQDQVKYAAKLHTHAFEISCVEAYVLR